MTANEAAAAAPVQSVNGQTGAVTLDAEDVNALPEDTEFAIGYDEASTIGSAAVGTAMTAASNYTPSGDIVLQTQTVQVANNGALEYAYDSSLFKLVISGVAITKTNITFPTGVSFVGSGVNFVVEKNVQSNAVGTGAADYMEI